MTAKPTDNNAATCASKKNEEIISDYCRKVDSVCEMFRPKNVKSVCEFVCACVYYVHVIHNNTNNNNNIGLFSK